MGGKGSGDKPFSAESAPEKKKKCLEALAEMGVVSYATEAAGISRRTYYTWLQDDPEFAEAARQAHEIATDLLEREARRRATKGVPEPVYYQGTKVGTVQKYSDTLLIFLLNGERPDKYAKRIKQDTTMRGGLTLNHLTDDDLDAKLAELEKLEGGAGGTD